MTFFISFAITLAVSFPALATWADDFEELKNIPRSYEDSGSICEEIARLDVKKDFPAPQYEVINGIAYGDSTRVIGELDVVVLDRNLNKVVKIAEVKCWKDLRGGLRKAREQRSRFLANIASNKKLFFQSTSDKSTFQRSQFEYVQDFISIGQQGAVSSGYEQELNYSLRDLHKYRIEMLRCQDQGRCAKP